MLNLQALRSSRSKYSPVRNWRRLFLTLVLVFLLTSVYTHFTGLEERQSSPAYIGPRQALVEGGNHEFGAGIGNERG